VFVHIPKATDAVVKYIPALIRLTGTLQVGPREEVDGHVSSIRLLLDAGIAHAVLAGAGTRGSSAATSGLRMSPHRSVPTA
jgi:hypothetical protein